MSTLPPVSIFLATYNQERFVEEALAGVFAQQYPDLEIILSDDASTDGTPAILRAAANAYRGPHRVKLLLADQNLGVAAHLAKIVANVSTPFVVGAAGDDISLPNRTERLVNSWQELGGGTAYIISDFATIDEVGRRTSDGNSPSMPRTERIPAHEILAFNGWRPGATCAFTVDLVRRFGPMAQRVNAEDAILQVRAVLCGSIGHRREELVLYRQHDSNLSNNAPRFAVGEEHYKRRLQKDISQLPLIDQMMDDLRIASSEGWVLEADAAPYRALLESYRAFAITQHSIANAQGLQRFLRFCRLAARSDLRLAQKAYLGSIAFGQHGYVAMRSAVEILRGRRLLAAFGHRIHEELTPRRRSE